MTLQRDYEQKDRPEKPVDPSFTRRQLLGGALGGAALLGGASLLPQAREAHRKGTLLSPRSLAQGVSELPGGKPVRGGTFTLGLITNGSEENVFPGTAVATPDFSRDFSLYNNLFYPNSGRELYPLVPGLALSAEPNSTATTWVLKLRDGVTFHDGKPFTADDVVYNLQHLWNDSNLNYSSEFLVGTVDFKGVRILDKLSLEIPLKLPMAQFPSIFAFFNFGVLPEGATKATTASHPIGTGPFKYISFTPGQQSVFVANKDYWEHGKPYVDKLVIDSSFTDYNSLLNALLSNELNLVAGPDLVQARAQLTAKQVYVLESPTAGQSYMFGMRVDKGPFEDNRIREAFKLLVNRQEMIDGALAGFGSVANDLISPLTQFYASDLHRHQDIEQAKYLFKKAGVAGKTFVWPTTNALPGVEESATVLAEQAPAAGIKVQLDVVASSIYWTAAGKAYVRYASQNVDQPAPSMTGNYRGELTRGCPWPDTHWGYQKPGGIAANDLILRAMGELNSSKAEELWREVQLEQFNEGGYVVWGNLPYIDLAAMNVRGLKASASMNFNIFRLQDGWLV